MFKIVFKSLGQDVHNHEILCKEGHIRGAEARASQFVDATLGGRDFDIRKYEASEYTVFCNGVIVGSFSISVQQ